MTLVQGLPLQAKDLPFSLCNCRREIRSWNVLARASFQPVSPQCPRSIMLSDSIIIRPRVQRKLVTVIALAKTPAICIWDTVSISCGNQNKRHTVIYQASLGTVARKSIYSNNCRKSLWSCFYLWNISRFHWHCKEIYDRYTNRTVYQLQQYKWYDEIRFLILGTVAHETIRTVIATFCYIKLFISMRAAWNILKLHFNNDRLQ